jgi:hypothetical protein
MLCLPHPRNLRENSLKGLILVAGTLAGLAAGMPAQAQFAVSAGVEYFSWTENTSPIEVEETGPMFALGLEWTQRRERGFLGAYRGRFYIGDVDYEGALLLDPTVGVAGTSSYLGMSNEGQLRYRMPSERGYWLDVVGAAGFDLWERKLDTDQQEDYRIGFVRLGVEIGPASEIGVTAALGIKYPLWTEEDANLLSEGYDQNPTLEPGKDASLYGQIGYRFRRNLAVVGYVDGFRFKESEPITVTQGGNTFQFVQPQSTMLVLGVKLQYLF